METSLHTNPKFPVMPRQRTYKFRTIITSRTMQQQMTNFYKVLSLETQNVGFEEIKKAYRSIALRYHPDVCPPSTKEESTKRFIELREAYETLSDPISRKMYDYELGLGIGLEVQIKERGRNFPKEVWEKQLYELRRRSHVRLERKNRYNFKKGKFVRVVEESDDEGKELEGKGLLCKEIHRWKKQQEILTQVEASTLSTPSRSMHSHLSSS